MYAALIRVASMTRSQLYIMQYYLSSHNNYYLRCM